MGRDLASLRVDQVGSLLRPQKLKDAFADYGQDKIKEHDLYKIQDDAIRDVVAKQIAHNLPVVVDGEFRRTSFMESFAVVAGVEEWQTGVKTYHEILARKDTAESVAHKGQDPILLNRKRVTERLQLVRNALLDDFRFTQDLTDRAVKVTLISADRISQCYDSEASRAVYPTVEEFLRDVVAVQRQMIGGLARAGCRYVGVDGPGYTAYVDPDSLAAMRSRGENPITNLARSIAAQRNHRRLPKRHFRRPYLPRQPAEHVASRRTLRRHRGAAFQWLEARAPTVGIRYRARRRFRTAAFCAER